MSFTRVGVQTELDRFFKALSHCSNSFDIISKSAFTQSRKKLDPATFITLNKSQLKYFEDNAAGKKHWKQKRIVAIDGSLLNLPHTTEIEEVFGATKNQHERVVGARCSFAYDVCNELILDAKIEKRNSCEKELAVQHLQALNSSSDILLFDRGYPCQWLIGLLMKQGFKFCFRLSTSWKDAVDLMRSGKQDIDWTLTRRSKRGLEKISEYHIAEQISGLRLVSIELSSGEKEILATNLTDREHFSVDDLKELYHLRWGIEESYKTFKKVLHIEHFTGRSALAIRQDFYAKVLLFNMASMIRTQAIDSSVNKKKHNLKGNKTQVLAKVKDFLVDIFYSPKATELIGQMLAILRKRVDIIRPNRSFKRTEASSRRRHRLMNSKGI